MDSLESFIASGGQMRRSTDLQIPPSVQAARDADAAVIKARETMPEGGGAIPIGSVVEGTQVGKKDNLEEFIASGGGASTSPASKSEQAPISPNVTGSNTENFLAGAGKGLADIGVGVKQLMDIPAQWLERHLPGVSEWAQKAGFPSAAESAAKTEQEVAESKRLDEPLMVTPAGIAGNVAGTIAGTMLPLAGAAKMGVAGAEALLNPRTYKAAAAAGALMGATQPTAEGESRAANVGLGAGAGMLGNAVVNAVGRIAQPVKGIVAGAYQKAVNVLENAGIPLDAAQKTGSTLLNRLRSGFTDNPFTAPAQQALAERQREGFNKAVLGTMGEQATHATPEVMGRAVDRINGVFKRVLDSNDVSITDTILNRIGAVQAAAVESEKKPVASIANRIIDAVQSDGTVKGQVAYGIKKDLDRLASSADTDLAYHARQLRGTLMDAINGSLDATDKKAFATARGQFANMKKIENAIDREGTGNISPARLANVMGQKANRSMSVYGKGPQELVDLAYAGKLLLPDKFPNSGTASRLLGQAFWPVVGGMSGAHYGDSTGAGVGAGLGLVAGRAAPRAAQILMQNPAVGNYLGRGIQGTGTPIRNLLLLPQTSPAVGGVLRRLPAALETNRKP